MAALTQRIGLKPGFDASRIPNQSATLPVNMYAEAGDGKGPFPLVGYPGRDLRLQMFGQIRGSLTTPQGEFYVVAGQGLYRVGADWSTTEIGAIAGDGLVEMVLNRVQMGIVATPRWYVFEFSLGTLHEVTATKAGDVFPGASSVAVIDNIGLIAVPGSDRFYFTDADDFRTVRDLSFATAESESDAILAIRDIGGEFMMGGPRSIEFWVKTGVANFPYERRNVVSDYGMVSRDACRKVGDSIVFLGTDAANGGLQVYRTVNYAVDRISNHAVERLIESARYPERARAVVWRIEGHVFYELTTDAGSVVLDGATGEWHRAAFGTWDYTSRLPPPSRLTSQSWVDGRNIMGTDDGKLIEAGFGFNADAGTPMVRTFVSPAMGATGRQLSIYAVGLEVEGGLGSLTVNPEVWMMYSGDGAHRWGRPQVRKIGLEGRYRTSVSWGPQGQSADAALMFGMTDQAPLKITGAWADIEETDRR